MNPFASIAALAGAFIFSPWLAASATYIDAATPGLYNTGLGTALDHSNPFGSSYMFPGMNDIDASLTIPAGSAPDLSAAAAALGDWLMAPAAPGGTWNATEQPIPATWTPFTETAIIYRLDAGATGLSNVLASFGVDNGLYVWLDGVFLGGSTAPGAAYAGEFTLDLGTLSAGLHHLQILREDHGGSTGYQVSVTAEPSPAAPAPVPLPATLPLLAGALGSLILRRRR